MHWKEPWAALLQVGYVAIEGNPDLAELVSAWMKSLRFGLL